MHLKDMKGNINIPVYPAKALSQQLIDIAQYFKDELGGEITVPEETNQNDMILTLFSLVESSHLLYKLNQESTVESVLNGILTCVFTYDLAEETREKMINNFANKLADLSSIETGNKHAGARLRVLLTLWYGLDDASPVRYTPFCRLLELGAATNLLHRIPTDPIKIKEWIKLWKLEDNKVRVLWRTLHAALVKTGDNAKASRVMVELLKTFTLDTANEARDEAFQCMRDAVADPYAVSLDHLLHLKPVQNLKGQPVYELLNIFVTGKVANYVAFYERNAEAVKKMGVSHEANLRKIRLLAFLNMCRGKQEITHAEVEQQLLLAPHEVEDFIIDALKSRLISGKIDSSKRRFRVTTCIEPAFTKAKWQELRDELGTWQSQVRHMKRMLAAVTNTDTV